MIPDRPRVVHLDADLAVVDKAAWTVMHRVRGARGAPVLLPALRRLLAREVWPLHRLDRQTSGLVACALDPDVAARASADLRAGLWRKSYLALCRGTLPRSVIVDHPVRVEGRRRAAVTEVHPVQTFHRRFSLVECVPRTGRRHQIRAHLKHLGHPLVGDASYGVGAINRFFRERFGLQRFFLHARRLTLPHPGRLVRLDLESALPAELVRVLERLAAYRGPLP